MIAAARYCRVCPLGHSDAAASDHSGAADFERAVQAFSKRRISGALDLLHRAETGGHDRDACAAYRWLCWMLDGRFEEAWHESDRIAERGRPDPHRLWDGNPFAGRRVLIRCLHGYGDAIQFVRYARLVRRDAARVIVQTHPELVSLFRGMPFADDVITWPDDPQSPRQWDQQIEVMELPRAFRTTLATIPCEVPYLSAGAARSRIAPLSSDRPSNRPGDRTGHPPRIGLQWGAGDWDQARSVHLAELRPILDLRQFEFYSFQRSTPRLELAALESEYRILDVSGDSPEIIEAAADLMNIDLLITVDTMLAHLAGALARPVWLLLPCAADWRWMLDRRDSPWYPTMRLFRQASPGHWRPVIHEISDALPKFFGGR